MNKQYFFLKLNPPRPTFMMDKTSDEKTFIQSPIAYWTTLLNENIAILFGPVLDPKGAHGAGVVTVDNEEHLKKNIANDRANGLNHYEYYTMNAIFKQS